MERVGARLSSGCSSTLEVSLPVKDMVIRRWQIGGWKLVRELTPMRLSDWIHFICEVRIKNGRLLNDWSIVVWTDIPNRNFDTLTFLENWNSLLYNEFDVSQAAVCTTVTNPKQNEGTGKRYSRRRLSLCALYVGVEGSSQSRDKNRQDHRGKMH